jgi:hypothetical protein
MDSAKFARDRRSRSKSGQPWRNDVGLSGKKQGIELGFALNEGQIKILNGGFRLDVATTPRIAVLLRGHAKLLAQKCAR